MLKAHARIEKHDQVKSKRAAKRGRVEDFFDMEADEAEESDFS